MSNLRILILSFLVLQSCSSVGHIGRDEVKLRSICGIEGFTLAPSEHIVDEIEQPIIVRAVKGKLTNRQGGWPKDWPFPILFEIRKIGEAAIIRARADDDGNFEIPAVPEGRYCFKATVEGWQSVMGIIKVDRRASPKKSIYIVMEIAT